MWSRNGVNLPELKEGSIKMKGKLRLEVTPIEGEWERRSIILEICKKAIEAWEGDDITTGYKVKKYFREEGGVLLGNKTMAPFLVLKAIKERVPTKSCEECSGTGRVDDVKEEL